MKLSIIAILATCGLFAGCCGPKLDHTQLDKIEIDVTTFDSINWVIEDDSAIVNVDTLYINMKSMYGLIANQQTGFSLVNSAQAHSCIEDGFEGLKDLITSLKMECDQPYLGIPAGESINQHVKYTYYNYYYNSDSLVALDSIVNQLNHSNGYYNSDLNFVLPQKPTDSLFRKFKVKIKFQSGKQITDETLPINWQ